MKLPFLKFYPRDWIADPGLRSCGFAARGLWADLLCIMAASDRRGFLEIAGRPLTLPLNLARQVGGDPDEVARLLVELEEAGVLSRDDRGCIYSRRMVADAERSKIGQFYGVKGGNPALRNAGVNGANSGQPESEPLRVGVKGRVKGGGYRRGLNSEGRKHNLLSFDDLPENIRTEPCLAAVRLWLQHKQERRQPYKPTGLKSLLDKLGEDFNAESLPGAVQRAIANNWSGIYPDATPPTKKPASAGATNWKDSL